MLSLGRGVVSCGGGLGLLGEDAVETRLCRILLGSFRLAQGAPATPKGDIREIGQWPAVRRVCARESARSQSGTDRHRERIGDAREGGEGERTGRSA